jgi:hypothetical protein
MICPFFRGFQGSDAMSTTGLSQDIERRLAAIGITTTAEHRQLIERMSANEMISLIWRLARASRMEATTILNFANDSVHEPLSVESHSPPMSNPAER